LGYQLDNGIHSVGDEPLRDIGGERVTSASSATGVTGIREVPSPLKSVPAEYRHHQRLVTPGEGISINDAWLKWYDIRRPGVEIPQSIDNETRRFLLEEAHAEKLSTNGELGFVILHIADGPHGPNTLGILMVMTWRYANEIWKTFYLKNIDDDLPYEVVVSESNVPTYCVWELGAILHEQQAWIRFLSSSRDPQSVQAYLDDQFEGLV
jgi:hypothetical protein